MIAAPLSGAVLGPNLPGAACKGRAPLHDAVIAGESETDRADRHQRAVAVCLRCCPVLAACRAAVATLPRSTTGVWAGRVLDGIGHR